jgi:hypothetical protein
MQAQNQYMRFTILKYRIENTPAHDTEALTRYHNWMDSILEELEPDDDLPLAQTMATQAATQEEGSENA